MKKCKYCQKEIDKNAIICPYCQKELIDSSKDSLLIKLVLFISIMFLSYYGIKHIYDAIGNRGQEIYVCSNYEIETMENITNKYTENEATATENYKRKVFNFEATISEIKYNDFYKYPYLIVESGNISAEVELNDSQNSKVNNLKKGDKIKFCAEVSNISNYSLKLDNTIIK